MRLLYSGSHGIGLALTMILPACAASATREQEQVACANGRSFTLERDAKQARVHWGARKIDLIRRPSPLGERYDGQDSSVIVDGDFVAFVPEGDASWRDCHLEQS